MNRWKVGESIQLGDLVGPHALTGVDFECIGENPANSILFILDGVTFRASEDENDGYRSCLQDIVVVESPVSNRFPEVQVIGCHLDTYNGYRSDMIEFRDAVNGKDVLSIGTENIDDYYPSYVANFTPENMAINAGKEGK